MSLYGCGSHSTFTNEYIVYFLKFFLIFGIEMMTSTNVVVLRIMFIIIQIMLFVGVKLKIIEAKIAPSHLDSSLYNNLF